MFACDSCDEAFTENRNLTRHITAVHNKKTFNCFHCDFVANRKDNFARHIKSKHLPKRSADVLEMNSEPKEPEPEAVSGAAGLHFSFQFVLFGGRISSAWLLILLLIHRLVLRLGC